MEIRNMHENLNTGTLTQKEQRETRRKLTEKESALGKTEEHLAKGT
jgi:hypothetical protein